MAVGAELAQPVWWRACAHPALLISTCRARCSELMRCARSWTAASEARSCDVPLGIRAATTEQLDHRTNTSSISSLDQSPQVPLGEVNRDGAAQALPSLQ